MAKENVMDFEKKLGRLEEIVQGMEGGDLALEKSLELFEEGIRLSKECHVQLNAAEQKVKQLLGVDENGSPILKEFKPQ
ncbi:MAG TPA: exodeoxyribonuclease VII small subunit [Bdellovibrionales bacterium]|nr:exodeoxyribonuclease VII small subunit [Bdellovibrionales bacterium]